MDCAFTGVGAELVYEYISGGLGNYDVKFSSFAFNSVKNSYYADYCGSASDLIGCIGLRSKKFCILNKQYSEEEYREISSKILDHMKTSEFNGAADRVYKYGEFFPVELSPFAYNETIAQEYFPLTKEKAADIGFKWREPEEREYKVDILPEDLADSIQEFDEAILEKTIGCSHGGSCNHQCTYRFRLIQDEFQFYKKINLPIPRLCPNCRHYERLKHVNPLKLWDRRCMCDGSTNNQRQTTNNKYQNTIQHFHGENPCPNKFETSYAPERSEIVYCEQCYNAEVV